MSSLSRERYAALYGPTAGDRIRLADTNLLIQIEEDHCVGGDEVVIGGNGKILTAGAIDTHVHLICPQIVTEALGGGVTTLVGGGTGPAEGTKATTVTPNAWHLARMHEAMDVWPVNVLLLGKGNTV